MRFRIHAYPTVRTSDMTPVNLAIRVIVALIAIVGMTGCTNGQSDHAMHTSTDGKPVNYLKYSDDFASAGMPDAQFINTLASSGVDAVVNIAPPDSHGSLENEAELVAAASMTYLNIPVDWNAPTQHDVDQFLSFMQSRADESVFLHCQMNMRATAFAMLHRVINQGADPAAAENDMHQIWEPNRTWAELINGALDRHAIDYQVDVPAE